MSGATTPTIVALSATWSYVDVSGGGDTSEYFSSKPMQKEISRAIAWVYRGAGARAWVGREMRLSIGENAILARLVSVDPPLANVIDQTTLIYTQYRERPKDQAQDTSNFIADIIRYPAQAEFGQIFDSLVGIDAIKHDIRQKLALLLVPGRIEAWAKELYTENAPTALLTTLRNRYPLIILEGEVGSGKTALARSVGFPLSQDIRRPITLFVVNAQVRGGGHVGELSLNIARAFAEAERSWDRERTPVLILLDEADALAQARGGSQRHVEDDAGVNTLIQQIDRLRGKPIAVLFATNLVHTLDAALLRRAIGIYRFDRPDKEQRVALLRSLVAPIGLRSEQIAELAELTSARPIPGFASEPQRYTYSDLTQRIIPSAVESAIERHSPLTFELLVAACRHIPPTPELSQHQKGR